MIERRLAVLVCPVIANANGIQQVLKLKASNESAPYNSPNDDIMFGRFAMRRFLLVFLSVLSLLVTGCKNGGK